MPFDEKKCGTNAFGIPVELKTSDGMIFYLAGRQQCETLRFWLYMVGYMSPKLLRTLPLIVENRGITMISLFLRLTS